MNAEAEPKTETRRRLELTGAQVQREGKTITLTVDDPHEAELLEDVLKDGELLLFLILVATLRRLPADKTRFTAVTLTRALIAAQQTE